MSWSVKYVWHEMQWNVNVKYRGNRGEETDTNEDN